MTHTTACRWILTTNAECEYRQTHHYCPHPEHACDCRKPKDAEPARVTPETPAEYLLSYSVFDRADDDTSVAAVRKLIGEAIRQHRERLV